MLDVLSITFPIFALIGLGYGLVFWGVFTTDNMRVFGKYVLNIALPALLFKAVASHPIKTIFEPTYMVIYALSGLAMIIASYLWFTLRQTDPATRASAVMGCACPNSGFVGYPIMLLAFPTLAEPVLAMNMLVENVVVIPIILVLFELAKDGGSGRAVQKLTQVLFAVLKRPMIIGMLIGLAISVSGTGLPPVALRVVDLLASSAAPIALIIIGGSLVGLKLGHSRSTAVEISVGKLIVHPLMLLGLLAVSGLTFDDPDMRRALILTAALPTISIYPVLSQELGREGLASLVQVIATGAAFFTLTVVLASL